MSTGGQVAAGVGAIAGVGVLSYVLGRNSSERPQYKYYPPLITGDRQVGTLLTVTGLSDPPILKIVEVIGDAEEAVKPRKTGIFKVMYIDSGCTGVPVGTIKMIGVEEAYTHYVKIKEKK